jgi:hypothetical protein
VALCAFGINNVKLLLLSGIGQPYDPATGEGTVGRNYTYQTMSSATVFYDQDVILNSFMGAGALGMAIDEYNGDNFDHGPHGFIGGGYIACYNTGARPIQYHPVPEGTPRWGCRLEGGGGATLQPHGGDRLPRRLDGAPGQLSEPRPHLHRRVRQPASAPHLRLPAQRPEDVGLPDRPGARDRPGHGRPDRRGRQA